MNKHPKKSLQYNMLLLFLMVVTLNLSAQPISTEESPWVQYETAIERAELEPRKIMLFMEADWCSVCKQMKEEVFPNEEIGRILNDNFYAVRFDIESQSKIRYQGQRISKKAFSKKMGLYATPTFLFMDPDGSVIGNMSGYMDTAELQKLLIYIDQEAYLNMDLEAFKPTKP